MNCPHCAAPGQLGRRCTSCGRRLPSAGGRAGVVVALLVVLVVVLGGGVALALRSERIPGAAVAGAGADPTGQARPERADTEPDAVVPPADDAQGTDPPGSSSPDGDAEAPVPSTKEPATPEPMVVGVVYDTGGSPAGSFNASAEAGVERAVAELGVEVEEREIYSEDEREDALRDLADSGANPVIGVGFLFAEVVEDLAEEYPDTEFVVLDGYDDGNPNVHGPAFSEEEGSFLVGVAAALKSSSGRIAFLGGPRNFYTGYYEAGFVAGATAARPDIQVEVDYLGSESDAGAWDEPEAAEKIAAAWYAEGIDVVFAPAGASSEGVVDAAVLAGAGKWFVGFDYDDYLFFGPGRQQVVLTSMVKRYDEMLFAAVEAAQNGDLDRLPEYFGLADEGVGYSTSGGFVDDIVPQLEEWKAKIVSGEIVVPYE